MREIYFWLKSKKMLLILGLVVIFFAILGGFALKYLRYSSVPKIIIWAWERPENLLFISDKDIEVVFYAGTIVFSNSETVFEPRLQPLAVSQEISIIPVVRIVNEEKNNQLNERQISEAVELIIKTCSQEEISSCQIDFDVKNSEIDFYKKLILETRSSLPKSISLSITTLVSWCHTGSWLDSLPVDEAVPMFFRLGIDEYLIKEDLTGESFMKAKSCQRAIGISVDESLPQTKYLKNRRIYIFNPDSWTPEDFFNIMEEVERELAK